MILDLDDWLSPKPQYSETPESSIRSAANAQICGLQTESQKVRVKPCRRHPVPQSIDKGKNLSPRIQVSGNRTPCCPSVNPVSSIIPTVSKVS